MKQNKKTEYSILGALFLFGVLYNAFVEWLEDRHLHEGYVSYLVVFGSAVTITASIPIIGTQAAIKIFKCFCASGMPMVLGSCHRHQMNEDKKNVAFGKLFAEFGRLLGGMDGNTTKNRANKMESGDHKSQIS